MDFDFVEAQKGLGERAADVDLNLALVRRRISLSPGAGQISLSIDDWPNNFSTSSSSFVSGLRSGNEHCSALLRPSTAYNSLECVSLTDYQIRNSYSSNTSTTMPSSKRNRIIPTSRTKKNRKDLLRRLHSSIQSLAITYRYIYVFDVLNMRNTFMKQVRTDFSSDSRIVMGKTKVTMVALGKDEETEVVPGVSQLEPYIKGEVGLLFTNRDVAEVQEYFAGFANLDFARSGTEAPMEVRIPPGEIYTQYAVDGGEDDLLPLQIEPQLRKLGVPTRIKQGKVVLEDAPDEAMDSEEGYVVCNEGDMLDPRQTSILKILGVRMSEFKMGLRAVYDKTEGSVKDFAGMDGVET